MNTWYYTLVFIFSVITTISLLSSFVIKLFAVMTNKIELNYKEKIVYAVSISYLITYLIYI